MSEAMEAAQGDESHGEAERQNESESDLGRTKHGEDKTMENQQAISEEQTELQDLVRSLCEKRAKL